MPLVLDGTNGVSGVDGTAASPAIEGTDSNTGIFFPAADTIAFAEGGTEVARFDSSGNFGIGTSSPSQKLTIFDATNATTYQMAIGNVAANSYNIGRNFADGLLTFYGTQSGFTGYVFGGVNGERMRIDSSGNVGIGTSTPTQKLDVKDGRIALTEVYDVRWISSGGTLRGSISADSGSNLYFGTGSSNTERARIDSSGQFMVNRTTSASSSAIVAKSLGIDSYQGFNTDNAFTFAVSGVGTIYAVSTTISAISDQRLKENIRDLDAGLAEVMALKPRLYDWKEGKGADIKNARGFIAQEFEEVFPDLIDEWRDPAPEGEEPYKSVRQDLIPVLVKAIQEQQQMIETLQAKVAALEAR